jgi:predicted dehydrogenase
VSYTLVMIDAGIVGLGWWGKNLVEAVRGKSNRLRFVRGACRDIRPVAAFAERHGLALSSSLTELLADENVAAVVLATPHSLHAEQIIASAEARKPVFCEKPLALTRDDAARAIDACRRHGVVLALGENNRFWPNMQEMLRIVASGELGESMHIAKATPLTRTRGGSSARGANWLRSRRVAGCLMGPVQSVSAQLVSRKSPPDPIDMLSAMFRFASGTTGLFSTLRSTPSYRRVHVFGPAGSAEALGDTELVIRRSGLPVQQLRFAPVDSLRAELDAFADAVAGRAAYPITSDEMLDTIAAFEALVASANRDGQLIVLR